MSVNLGFYENRNIEEEDVRKELSLSTIGHAFEYTVFMYFITSL